MPCRWSFDGQVHDATLLLREWPWSSGEWIVSVETDALGHAVLTGDGWRFAPVSTPASRFDTALAALAAIFLTLENKNFFGNQGQGYLLTAIASVLIGGTSIFGGRATIVGTVFGCFIIGMIEAGLVASGLTGAWVRTVQGLVFLAAIVFYIYAVIGVHMFGPHLKEYASLHEALFTLFRVLTGDNWTDLRYAMADRPFAWKATAYHVSWIVISTFLLINLIVGAVINNYQEVQEVERARRHTLDASDQRLAELVAELDRILKARRANGPASPEA